MSEWVVLAHNIRSAYNVGAIFRTADGAGASKVYLSGYSPVPAKKERLYRTSAQKMLSKTALGAEETVSWEYRKSLTAVFTKLRKEGFVIVALEQHSSSVPYNAYEYPKKTALLIGNEPKGIDARTLAKCDAIVEIPMRGSKNSLNVVVALGVVGYTIIVNRK